MYLKPKFALLLLSALFIPLGRPQTISTVAGSGTPGIASGDGGPATSAVIGFPQGVAVDGAGDIFIADGLNNRVRKVDTAGIISTYAGGSIGFNVNDGGPATSGVLGFIGTAQHQGIALDKSGNLYIADPMHNRIRKVDTNGIITTVAGNGTLGFSGDGGPATSAQLTNPFSVTVDSAGNFYIADTFNGRVRKVDTSGTITTVAGSGLGFVLNDGGPATGTQFEPLDLAVDGSGNLYISDIGNGRIRKVSGGIITSLLTSNTNNQCLASPPPGTGVGAPNGLAVDSAGNLFTADAAGCVHKVDISGNLTLYAGGGTTNPGDGGPATSAVLNQPSGVAADSSGNVYVSEQGGSRIRKIGAPTANPPSISSVQNAFGGGTTISPNMWVAVKGTNLAPPGDSRIWQAPDFVNNQLPTKLDNISVTVNNQSAFIYYVSPTQLNILTPYYALSGTVPVQVAINGVAGNVMMVPTASLAPSFFTFDGANVVGTHLDGTLLGPTTLYPGLSTPAKVGETVILYGNGFGNVATPNVNGALTQSGDLPAKPIVAIGGSPALVTFAGLISPGLFQFNVTIPPVPVSGNEVLGALYGGQQTPTGVKLAVQQ